MCSTILISKRFLLQNDQTSLRSVVIHPCLCGISRLRCRVLITFTSNRLFEMTSTYTRLLSRLPLPILKKHTRKFSHVFRRFEHSPLPGKMLSRHLCEKAEDLYTSINDEDFELYEKSSNYKDVDFESVAEGDPEKMKLLKRVQLEIDIFAQEGGNVPSKISSDHWLELISLPSKYRRLNHIKFLWKNESRKLAKKRKQQLYRQELQSYKLTKEARAKLTTASPVQYGLLATTLFHRLYDQEMKDLYNFRLLQASMFGPHLIIDCGFEEFMTQIDLSHCSKDMLMSWSANREHFYPFDMVFCNLHQDSKLFSRLCSVLPAIQRDPACPFNFTDKHYLDLYPKEKLVYLTPHSNDEMKSYDGDCVYIIGGLWDKSKDMALTLAKAKKEGIRRAKLPLDKFMKWNFGKKTLSISQCVSILNDMKDVGDWNFALRNIRRQQASRNAIFDDGEDIKANSKTAKYVEELIRRKSVYDILLTHTAKKK